MSVAKFQTYKVDNLKREYETSYQLNLHIKNIKNDENDDIIKRCAFLAWKEDMEMAWQFSSLQT